jgi:DNA-binding transcriptional ArsR family regulator
MRSMLICVSAQIDRDPEAAQVELAVEMLKLLADQTRLRILWALLHGEHSVNNLADHVGAQPSAVSQHLAKLRMARMVRVRREGNRMFYAAEDAHVRRLVEEALFHADHLVGEVADQARDGSPASAAVSRRRQA